MPELPEVETAKRILEPQLAGRRIIDVTANRPEILAHPSPEEFCGAVRDRRIRSMDRRGKFLLICLEDGGTIILHLRMTGQLLVTPGDYPERKHTHLVFLLDDGNHLRFIDTRRFGRFWLLRQGETDSFSGIGKLGPEPFDGAFCGEYLWSRAGKRRKAIKECLLDQSLVAGIGNIYGDEILFAAGIAPLRKASELGAEEWERLAEAIPAVLRRGIEDNDLTPEEYLAEEGREYRRNPLFQVYGHEGQPCPRCGALLERVVIAGRSSCFCPQCQKGVE